MDIISFPKNPKNINAYTCTICEIKTSNKKDYNKHVMTAKHMNAVDGNVRKEKNPLITICECGKKYKNYSGLWKHKKKCIINMAPLNENVIVDASSNEIKVLTTLVLELVKNNTELQKQNQEFQKQVLDVCKNMHPTNINSNNNTTTNNKTFNLQFFLNEQCKDAMNLKDFVNSFQLNIEDLERVGKQGYVDGIAHIIIEKIKETDMHKRPFHCSDAKRETLYVKDDNVWEKEGTENLKMVKAVKDVGQKNFNVLNDYRLMHPDCLQSESEYNDKYIKLMIQAVGSQKENVNKVIKKIAKEVLIEKE